MPSFQAIKLSYQPVNVPVIGCTTFTCNQLSSAVAHPNDQKPFHPGIKVVFHQLEISSQKLAKPPRRRPIPAPTAAPIAVPIPGTTEPIMAPSPAPERPAETVLPTLLVISAASVSPLASRAFEIPPKIKSDAMDAAAPMMPPLPIPFNALEATRIIPSVICVTVAVQSPVCIDSSIESNMCCVTAAPNAANGFLETNKVAIPTDSSLVNSLSMPAAPA